METVIKAYVSLFFLAVLTVLTVTVGSITIQGKTASEYASSISALWQESNYTLKEEDFKDSLPEGYTLSLKKTGTTSGVMTLSYCFDAPLFGLNKNDTESGRRRYIVRTVR